MSNWKPQHFIFHSGLYFEDWDWRNSIERGIGGSETNHVEMAWRLARRGHRVTCYSPIPNDCSKEWRGTKWEHVDSADYSAEGIWLVYRQPEVIDKIEPSPNRKIWFVAQDEWYGGFTDERVAKLDRFMAFCPEHAKLCLSRAPQLASKMWITSNGLKCDLLREVEAEGIQRNPFRLMYASSPDRGLKWLLSIFKRAKEFVPDLELHAFYGFDNIDKLAAMHPRFKYYLKLKEEIEKLSDQPGVVWRGRVPQRQLYREWLSSGMWCYPTNFFETSCITCMESQACGAIPITNPIGALGNNVRHGIFIEGDAWSDRLVQARYAAEIVRLASNPKLQDEIRRPMMKDIRSQYNWERWVDQWEAEIYGVGERNPWCQYNFQIRHAWGRVLNVGCDVDMPKFGEFGGVNVDLKQKSPILGCSTKLDYVADARELPDDLSGRFDSVVLGDILEHMNDTDAVRSLKCAVKALENGGDVIITCPDDSRPEIEQHDGRDVERYADGEHSLHVMPVPKSRIETWLGESGLRLKHYQELDYGFSSGHGIVATKQEAHA